MVKVAIVYPPIKSEKGVPLLTQNRQFQWFSRPTYIFPVVPAYAATRLKKAGAEVLFLDGIAAELSTEEFEQRLFAFEPDLIVLETKTPVLSYHLKAAHHYAEKLPRVKVVMVGDHVTARPDDALNESAVQAVIKGGDWDAALEEYIKDGMPKGVFAAEMLHSLENLPRIDRELVDWRLYAKKNGNFRKTPGTYIMAGRDCWHAKCTFCSWTTLYPKYRVRPYLDVVDEIEELVTKYGVKEIMDDSGSFPIGQWLKDFCEEMIRRGLNKRVRLDCNMRFGVLKREDYRLMRKAGFRLVLFGVESANQATLDKLNKALKVEDVRVGAKWASEAGLDVHLTFMFGYPWEGKAEMANTIELARELLRTGAASTLQCTLTIPYPGTPLFEELKAKGELNSLDWDDYDMRRAIMKTPLVTEEEIREAIQKVYRGFFQWGALWRRLLKTRSIADLGFYYRGVKSLFGHLFDFSHHAK